MQKDCDSENFEIKEDQIGWKKEQDTYLKSLVGTYGTRNWVIVAESFNSKFPCSKKSACQCKARWQSAIEVGSKKHPWDDAERLRLLLGHQKYKNKWSDIAKNLIKRSSNRVKNRFYSLFRKIKNKIKRGDFFVETSIDVLETYYVISLFEIYQTEKKEFGLLEDPKDYIYKLTSNLEPQIIAGYKDKFFELHKEEGTMETIFTRLAESNRVAFKTNEVQSKKRVTPEETNLIPIQLLENNTSLMRSKLELPEYKKICPVGGITLEEKEGLWKMVFLKKDPTSANQYKVTSAPGASTLYSISANSVYPSVIRHDEYNGFSQFASEFEYQNMNDTQGHTNIPCFQVESNGNICRSSNSPFYPYKGNLA